MQLTIIQSRKMSIKSGEEFIKRINYDIGVDGERSHTIGSRLCRAV